ncbi:Misato segment II tubulin-like domain-containing protein [Baffinella frigidus]|nr:Misato segment II tubulin-like domain-containing protein [Cryptophyta sp. CCMP2293]
MLADRDKKGAALAEKIDAGAKEEQEGRNAAATSSTSGETRMVREIMSVQLGGYSNFAGAHFWNLQALNPHLLEECMSYSEEDPSSSEVVSEIMFRAGQTERSAETYVPRLMLLGLKDERGSMRRTGYLYDDTPMQGSLQAGGGDLGVSVTSWGGATQIFASEPVALHPFVERMAGADGWRVAA